MKRYSKKWRAGAWILLVLFLISLVSIIFLSGCGTKQDQTREQEKPIWMLLKLPDGNYVHTKIVRYKLIPDMAYYRPLVMIYTEDRTYVAAPENVVFIQDLEVQNGN